MFSLWQLKLIDKKFAILFSQTNKILVQPDLQGFVWLLLPHVGGLDEIRKNYERF
jgi:hypothetical protein